MIAITSFLLIILLRLIQVQTGHLFYTEDGEANLVKWVKAAQSNLRIFVYPTPDNVQNHEEPAIWRPHFQIEQRFTQYLNRMKERRSQFSPTDYKAHLVVGNASNANAFVINHHWINKARRYANCTCFFMNHLYPIINNVVDDHPYYNQSNGRNHFFFAVYDNGGFSLNHTFPPICFTPKEKDRHWNKNILLRIDSANFIGNYAKISSTTYNNNSNSSRQHSFDEITFILNQDIVLPQPIEYIRVHESKQPWLVHREYDSSFAGTIWGDRDPLRSIHENQTFDYEIRRTERFANDLTGINYLKPNKYVNQATNFTELAYFSYNPCGLGWCWSKRVFDSMQTKGIPILSGSDIVMPFERFINWREISVKMCAETWHTPMKLEHFRRGLRFHADHFRIALMRYWSHIGVDYLKESSMQTNYTLGHLDLDTTGRKLWDDLTETLIWRKMDNIQRVLEWVTFDEYINERLPSKHPIQLLQLEMWCRVTNYEQRFQVLQHSRDDDLCERSSSVIADQEYFD